MFSYSKFTRSKISAIELGIILAQELPMKAAVKGRMSKSEANIQRSQRNALRIVITLFEKLISRSV